MFLTAGSWCSKQSDDELWTVMASYENPNSEIDLKKLYSKLTQWQQTLVKKERELRRKYPLEQDNHHLDDANALHMPTIYAITPTYARPVQKAELTRLANTFLHVPNFHWIIIEDSSHKTQLVSNFLKRTGLNYTHLNVGTPAHYKMQSSDPNWLKPRGVLQRNEGLKWLKQNFDPDRQRGVVYFADDDNTYDLQLFDEVMLMVFIYGSGMLTIGVTGKFN